MNDRLTELKRSAEIKYQDGYAPLPPPKAAGAK
jgi:hypothetical protein